MTNDKSINRREMLGIAGKSAAAIAIMPALQAKTQVHPTVTHFQTFLAAFAGRLHFVNLI